ncbi:transglutaminase-like cysteine peptidase [Ferrimonas pelagia]|uniref:Transglutaminase-like cysteine proteinase BTLCP n=1 Tax=Ferrimonas pelagia TaxID=1177826 RepID=A0ABP9F4E6_9GAMM
MVVLFCPIPLVARLCLLLGIGFAPWLWALEEPALPWQQYFVASRLDQLERRFGLEGRQRVEALEQWLLTELAIDRPTLERLDVVNRYFNRLQFVDDQAHWGVADHWATPLEMVASGGGDCEDFVILKYMVLRILRLPPEALRLMYVKAIELDQAHMVLLYLDTPQAMPLVLDNLIDTIETGEQRSDLLPVYSFNAGGLWKARAFDQGTQLKAGESGVDLWGELVARLIEEGQG